MRALFVAWALFTAIPALACTKDGQLCKVGPDCCSGVCTPRVGLSSICTASTGKTTTTVKPSTTTTTTLPPASSIGPVRPTGADIGQALLAGKGSFYVWYRGALADQPVRDAMQQYVTGVLLPELSRVLETTCPQAIHSAYAGEGGQLDVIYRRLGNVYENLSNPWSIGPNGRNYSFDVGMLERFRDCVIGQPEVPGVHVGLRDALTVHLENGRYAKWDPNHPSFFVFPQPTANEAIGRRAPVNVRLSFPPKGHGLDLLRAADSAHAAASGIGLFPVSVDAAAQAYEGDAKSRDELHFRQMKRFTGFCDPRWGVEDCWRWKLVQHRFFHLWTAAEEAGNWRDARNADSDHQLAHICTNYWNPDLDVRFSVPGVDEHLWPISNCATALARFGG